MRGKMYSVSLPRATGFTHNSQDCVPIAPHHEILTATILCARLAGRWCVRRMRKKRRRKSKIILYRKMI
jgi:hypothetical protein